MKAIVSTTYDDKYLYFLPIITWCWNKLGVDVICFVPNHSFDNEKVRLIVLTALQNRLDFQTHYFDAPEHKEATYAQCSRLYAACLDLSEDEVLITGDIDMANFCIPPHTEVGPYFTIFGSDLVPPSQYPMCYLSSTVEGWRRAFPIQYGALKEAKGALVTLETRTYQECLDNLLGEIDCENMRGNYWGKDQEEAYNRIDAYGAVHEVDRARPGTQFASLRYDRDDAYLLDRLDYNTYDYHMPRPGYEENAFNQILTVLKYHYPHDNFDWLIQYTEEYKKLL
jgi:hypothetical protein